MSCGAVEVLAEAIPKAYDDLKLLEEYCRSLKYLMHKGKAPLPPYNFRDCVSHYVVRLCKNYCRVENDS